MCKKREDYKYLRNDKNILFVLQNYKIYYQVCVYVTLFSIKKKGFLI